MGSEMMQRAAAQRGSRRRHGSLSDEALSSETRFTSAMMASSVAVTLTDCTKPDNPIVLANQAFTALTGYSREDAIGRNMRFLQGPGTDRAVIAEIREAVSRGESIRRDLLNYRKDGQPFWNDIAIDPIHDQAGR